MKSFLVFIISLFALTVIGCQESVSIPETANTEVSNLNNNQGAKEVQKLNMHLVLDNNESIRITSLVDVVRILSDLKTDQLNK